MPVAASRLTGNEQITRSRWTLDFSDYEEMKEEVGNVIDVTDYEEIPGRLH
jgi:hypothetical protein